MTGITRSFTTPTRRYTTTSRVCTNASTRELDLHSGVLRHPLSFLIYSEGFDSLPLLVREHLYEKLAQNLHATPEGEVAFNILVATKPEFAQEVKTLSD